LCCGGLPGVDLRERRRRRRAPLGLSSSSGGGGNGLHGAEVHGGESAPDLRSLSAAQHQGYSLFSEGFISEAGWGAGLCLLGYPKLIRGCYMYLYPQPLAAVAFWLRRVVANFWLQEVPPLDLTEILAYLVRQYGPF